MNDLSLFSVGIQIACYTVVETHTDRNQHITFIRFHIRRHISMHSQKTFIQAIIGRHGRCTQQSPCSWNIGFIKKCHQLLLCISQHNTLSDQCIRLLG